jgi:hypothetical protein
LQIATVATVEACTPRACTVADVTVCRMMLDLCQNPRVARKSVRKRCEQFCGRHGVRASRAHINHMCTRPMQFTREINCKRSCLQSETTRVIPRAPFKLRKSLTFWIQPHSFVRRCRIQTSTPQARALTRSTQEEGRGSPPLHSCLTSHKLTNVDGGSFEQCKDGQLAECKKGVWTPFLHFHGMCPLHLITNARASLSCVELHHECSPSSSWPRGFLLEA